MLRYIFAVMFLVFAASISEGLEVGDSALRTPIMSGDREINFADFHGKSNLIVLRDFPDNPEFVSQVQQKSGALQEKYDATVLRLQEEGETLIVDKSGYVRWKFPNAADSAQPVIEQFESELAKLKRDKPLPIGSPAPDFRLVNVETGLFFHLAKYKDKKHVLATLLLQTY
ncbi:MAG: hypothetical protein MJE68_29205 [Proteobacteria bacterium]|nr:hypothetical protein [Pseudomonadota bacterium]